MKQDSTASVEVQEKCNALMCVCHHKLLPLYQLLTPKLINFQYCLGFWASLSMTYTVLTASHPIYIYVLIILPCIWLIITVQKRITNFYGHPKDPHFLDCKTGSGSLPELVFQLFQFIFWCWTTTVICKILTLLTAMFILLLAGQNLSISRNTLQLIQFFLHQFPLHNTLNQ